ncbi:hypothetical protein [Bosea sp. MMO-172]|uniref:hypothetical protein n=1 Tax=Bosea sp. MMO-172 TaxID=3127885 RepID=UPI003017EFEE
MRLLSAVFAGAETGCGNLQARAPGEFGAEFARREMVRNHPDKVRRPSAASCCAKGAKSHQASAEGRLN